VHANDTVTSELFHPAALGAGAGVAITDKGASCTLSVTLVDVVFPALSVADPLKTCPAPAVVTLIGAGHTAMPESPSEQLNVTTAGAVTTPFAPGTGAIVAVMAGGVLSMFSVVLALAVCPAASVAVALMTWFAPSSDTVCAAGHCSGGTPPAQVNETVTSELFHPAALAAGAALALTESAVCCTFNVSVVEAELPALSVAVPLNLSLAPAVVTLIDAGQLAVPESASVQVKDTTAGRVTTPLIAAGITLAVIPGFVLSMFSVTATEAWLPLASVAVAETT
jgi:hypothetical protein